MNLANSRLRRRHRNVQTFSPASMPQAETSMPCRTLDGVAYRTKSYMRCRVGANVSTQPLGCMLRGARLTRGARLKQVILTSKRPGHLWTMKLWLGVAAHKGAACVGGAHNDTDTASPRSAVCASSPFTATDSSLRCLGCCSHLTRWYCHIGTLRLGIMAAHLGADVFGVLSDIVQAHAASV